MKPLRRATDVCAVLIAVAGFAVSYTTQATLASEHGFAGWEAWLWPGIADAAAIVVILRLHFGQVRRGFSTVEAWLVFGVASTIAVGANAVADRSDPLGGAMHAAVPIMTLLVWHVVIHGRPVDVPKRDKEQYMERDTGRAVPGPESTPPRLPARVHVRSLLKRRGADVTPAMVAARTGVSQRHAARLLKEERQLRVAEG